MNLSLGQAAIYSLIGIMVVFFALILLMCIIKIMTHFTYKKPTEEPVPAEAAPVEKELAPGSAGELKLYDTDERTAAMIMAIVADEMQTPLNQLRFKSIREVKDK